MKYFIVFMISLVIVLSYFLIKEKFYTKQLEQQIVKMRDFPDLQTWEKWHFHQQGLKYPESYIIANCEVHEIGN